MTDVMQLIGRAVGFYFGSAGGLLLFALLIWFVSWLRNKGII